MADYRLSVYAHSRSKGHCATAAAAYRSGGLIRDERTGEVHDYTKKRGITHTQIVLPEDAPEWSRDRSKLWNAAERSETRKNSVVSRDIQLSLPAELSPGQRQGLALEFAREVAERHRCAVDVALHSPDAGGDNRNFHAQLLLDPSAGGGGVHRENPGAGRAHQRGDPALARALG
jgi:MobA/MobL family